MKRRLILKGAILTGVAGLVARASAEPLPGACDGDGTPLQFMPKHGPDPDPLHDELSKFPRCPYCGMDRQQWAHSRHLIHYDDDRIDPTCSLHCVAISLSLNLDRGPKVIYAADFGSAEKPNPLLDVDHGVYLIGSQLRGTMTARSKMAFADLPSAEAAQQEHGGEIGNFDTALTASYLDMARDTEMIRRRRAERRARMGG